MSTLGTLASGIVGWTFLASAWSKARDRRGFRAIVAEYAIPPSRRGVAARSIPALELALGLALLTPWRAVQVPALAGALAFLCAASAFVGARLRRGERRFRCGCGGDLSRPVDARLVLLRNAGLVALAAAALVSSPAREPLASVLTAAAVVAGAGTAAAAWRAWGMIREWTAPG